MGTMLAEEEIAIVIGRLPRDASGDASHYKQQVAGARLSAHE